ncbi:MAG: hypothetical protein WCE94_15210 [Candidatus Methanoperedens sp.]
MGFGVSINGLDKLGGTLAKVDSIATTYLNDKIKKAALAVQQEAVRLVHENSTDTGKLGQSIQIIFAEKSATVGPTVEWGPFIEFGTRPHMPPSEPLEIWASRHGFDEGMGFVLAKKISEEGMAAKPFMGPASEKGRAILKNVEGLRISF